MCTMFIYYIVQMQWMDVRYLLPAPTWPAEAAVLVDPLGAGGAVLAGVRGTFGDVLLTVVTDEPRPVTVTLEAGGSRDT